MQIVNEHAIEFTSVISCTFGSLWQIVIIVSQNEIRKFMNFKQEGEREIKRKERDGEVWGIE